MAETTAPTPRKPRLKKAKVTPNIAERIDVTATNGDAALNGATERSGTSSPSLETQIREKAEGIRAEATRKAGEIGEEVTKLAGQAGDRAKDLANQGKHKAAIGLESLAQAIDDSATNVDDKLGKQYGDFARSAASTIAGLGGKLDQQDLDELVEATREFVKKSPAVAIGSAAVVGFMLARLLRGNDRA